MSERFSVDIRWEDPVVTGVLTGDVDLGTAEEIAATLRDAVPNHAAGLIVDLRGVAFMDSTGLHLLFDLDRRLNNRQQRLAVVATPGSAPARILELSGPRPLEWLTADPAAARNSICAAEV